MLGEPLHRSTNKKQHGLTWISMLDWTRHVADWLRCRIDVGNTMYSRLVLGPLLC